MGRTGTVDDVPAIATCLASAFHNDPVWGRWAFPEERTRADQLLRFEEYWARCAVRLPWTRIAGDGAAVAVWTPPGEQDMTEDEQAGFARLVADLFGARTRELESLFAQFEAAHPQDEPHYYLGWWGTHQASAGRGIGTALLQETLAVIDEQSMPAYLESTNPANIPRYKALGFEPRTEFGPPGGPVITTMWRSARTPR